MKKIISLMMVLLVIPFAFADSSVDIDVSTTGNMDADISLTADNLNVNINGGELANKEYINSLGQGGIRNRMTQIIVDATNKIKDGTIFNERIHEQTALIGRALVTTFITRSEDDLDYLYRYFRQRLVEDLANGEIDRLIVEHQNNTGVENE